LIDLGVRLSLDFIELVLSLAQLAVRRLDLSHELNERIVGIRDGFRASLGKLAAIFHVIELRAADKVGRTFPRAFAAEKCYDERIVAAPAARVHRQLLRQLRGFQIRIERRWGEELMLERFTSRVAVLAQAILAWFLILGGHQYEMLGDFVILAAKLGNAAEK